jgi:hypothetical protein
MTKVHGATDDAAKDKQEKILDAKITAAYQQPDEAALRRRPPCPIHQISP